MMDALVFVSARWAAFMWPASWDGLTVGLLVLAALPPMRRLPARWAMWLTAIALLKFVVPQAVLSPSALIDHAASWLRPPMDLERYESALRITAFIIYAVGLTIATRTLMRRYQTLQRWRTEATPVTDASTVADFTALATTLEISRLPDLLLSPHIDTPMAIGVRKPAILLPPVIDRLSRDERRVVLAHELLHHRERDLRAELVLAVASVTWWFHPVVAALVTMMRALREVRCDSLVVDAGVTTREGYCRVLLAVAAATLPSPAVAMRDVSHPLGDRFHAVLAGRRLDAYQDALMALAVIVFAALALPNSTWIR